MENGGMLIARFLKARGVQFLYTLCGGHISPILVGCKDQGIRVIDVRHEANAVFAADATARLTGIPGVAAVTAGPGVTNTITAIKNAQMAQSPLILLGGATPTLLKGRGSLQDIDQMSVMRSSVKYAGSVKRVKDLLPILNRAFKEAQDGAPGPVFVEIPVDLLYPSSVVHEWYNIKGGGKGGGNLAGKVVQWYIKRHARRLFSDVDETLPPVAAHRVPSASSSQVDKVRQLLRGAKKPVFLIGSQTTLGAASVGDLVKAVEKIGVPCYLSGMARGLLGKDHPLHMRHKRKMALKEADLVVLFGVVCDFRLDYGSHISRKATLASVNRDKGDLKKNRKPEVAVHGDPGAFLRDLAVGFSDPLEPQTWLSELRQRDEARNREIAAQAKAEIAPINPIDLCRKVEDFLQDNALFVADGGDFVATASYIVQLRRPLSWLDPGPFGTLGVGGGFALGAALCRPESEVWLWYGDGSCGYTLAEFDTFVRHNIGVIAVVGNDASWAQIERDQVEILKDDVGCVLRHTDYHQTAIGFGGEGLKIDSPEQIPEVLMRARELAAQNKPVLVNVLIGKTDFRKGSISM